MDIQIGILLGLAAMFFWGAADIFAKKVIRKAGVYRAILGMMSTGLVLMFVISLFFTNILYLPPDPLLILTAAFLNILGFIFYYKSIKKGKLSIVAPIGCSYGIVTVLLAIVLLNEALTKIQLLSTAAVIVGIILISTKFSELKKIKAVKGSGFAFLSMVMWGVYCFFYRNYNKKL